MSDIPQNEEKLRAAMNNIHSLGIASRDQVGGWQADTLLRQGLIHQVWIGNYALTEKGEQARTSQDHIT